MLELIDQARADGARLEAACEALGISPRTLQRWREEDTVRDDGRKAAATKRIPANKFSEQERQTILETVNSPGFANKSPNQIVPILADQDEYIGSESTIYRTLREAGQLTHRGKSKPKTHSRPNSHEADGPNQVWTWDITYLPTVVKGVFYYLYLILDIYSRKIVGWEVYECESDDYASDVVTKATLREGASQVRVLHSDNGSPMKGATMLATLQRLGIVPSFSRPKVSNDNAYSESLFKTLKYVPFYPDKPFENIDKARKWVHGFIPWYNEEHRHSALRFVTPGQRHQREDIAILEKRSAFYERLKEQNPHRWPGPTRNWSPIGAVQLNPRNKTQEEAQRLL